MKNLMFVFYYKRLKSVVGLTILQTSVILLHLFHNSCFSFALDFILVLIILGDKALSSANSI